MKLSYCILILISLCFLACKHAVTKDSSPTMGNINIACDVQIRDIIQQEKEIFEQNYKYAKIDLIFNNENAVFKSFENDSIKTAITCRTFNNNEIAYYNSVKQIHPRSFPFAKAALALLCNKEIRDSGIVYEDFMNLCKDIQVSNSGFNTVVLEDVGSGIARFLLDKIHSDHFSKNVYTLENKEAIFKYLNENNQAIAIVDWSEFSDSDNSIQQAKLKRCKVLGITRPKDSIQIGYTYPEQYLLQDNQYPLTRTYYFLSVSGKSDLGLGFASFITGEIGQRILLKAGLLPEYQTERWIELNNNPFKLAR